MTRAREHYTQCLEIFRRVGDLAFIAWSLLPLANIALDADELDESATLYNQSLPMMVDVRDRLGVGIVLLGLGMAEHYRGNKDESQRLIAEAQPTYGKAAAVREYPGGSRTLWSIPAPTICSSTLRVGIRRGSTYRPLSGHGWCWPMERPGAHAPNQPVT